LTCETLLFYGLAVFLAWQGFGVSSYAWAVLVRGIAGIILIYLLSPWKIGFAFEKESLRRLLRFGLPFQANTFLAVIKDRLMNVFLWKIVGATGVGILGWAQKWAQMPLRFVMDSVMKVTFPAYSRMQEHKEELSRAIEKTLFFLSLIIFPMLVGMAILAKNLVQIIPKYSKWEVALVALYLFIVNSLFAALTTPLTNALNAIGRIKVVFKLMVMWTVLTWIIYPILAIKYGVNYLIFAFLKSIIKPTIASVLMGLLVLVLSRFLTANILTIAFLIILASIFYFGLIYIMVGKQLIVDIKKLFYAFRNR